MKVLLLIIASILSGVLTSGCSINVKVPLYNQCDPKWSGLKLPSGSTMCQSGSLVCSLSAALAAFGKTLNGQTATPTNLLPWMKKWDVDALGHLIFTFDTIRSAGRAGLGYSHNPDGINGAKNAICANKAVFIRTKTGEWMLATSYEDNVFKAVNCNGGVETSVNVSDVERTAIQKPTA